jgi:hypothetical protein
MRPKAQKKEAQNKEGDRPATAAVFFSTCGIQVRADKIKGQLSGMALVDKVLNVLDLGMCGVGQV